jgi:hypothetical protein
MPASLFKRSFALNRWRQRDGPAEFRHRRARKPLESTVRAATDADKAVPQPERSKGTTQLCGGACRGGVRKTRPDVCPVTGGYPRHRKLLSSSVDNPGSSVAIGPHRHPSEAGVRLSGDSLGQASVDKEPSGRSGQVPLGCLDLRLLDYANRVQLGKAELHVDAPLAGEVDGPPVRPATDDHPSVDKAPPPPERHARQRDIDSGGSPCKHHVTMTARYLCGPPSLVPGVDHRCQLRNEGPCALIHTSGRHLRQHLHVLARQSRHQSPPRPLSPIPPTCRLHTMGIRGGKVRPTRPRVAGGTSATKAWTGINERGQPGPLNDLDAPHQPRRRVPLPDGVGRRR